MLTTRQEQREKLKELINFEIRLHGLVVFIDTIAALFLHGIIIWGAIYNNDLTLLWLCLFPGIIIFIPSFFCLPLLLKHIKAKKNLFADNFSYHYVPIDSIEGSGCRGSNHMNANYTYKGQERFEWCNNARAKRVHVFDCDGFIVAKVEEKKDLAV